MEEERQGEKERHSAAGLDASERSLAESADWKLWFVLFYEKNEKEIKWNPKEKSPQNVFQA